ncbi:DNA adenine methylase [Thermoanaerobacterium thermosaccharolyticum]|uniref:DNA adenine methylase n=2 Tax=Thermoanaerobacterium thermosaccharolyticum TaxID=1517 RepID=A0A223I1N3_THETR|nr:DNA adenine methylase [Thermoanaerobacterium thermosaccharolyticum]
MVIQEELCFVIEEGENMFNKDFKFVNYELNYIGDKYFSGSSPNEILFDYKQRGIDDDIKDFFNWLLDNLKNDIKALKENNYECLYDEYYKTEKLLKDKSNYISKYFYLNLLDYDSIQRLKKIFFGYKEEYEIFKNYKKDIVFYNDLLGWYKDIPDDVIMFIENLYIKQFENYTDAYITESKQIEILKCDDNGCDFAA